MYSEVLFKVVDTSLVGLYFFFGGILISHLINRITLTYGELSKKDINNISTLNSQKYSFIVPDIHNELILRLYSKENNQKKISIGKDIWNYILIFLNLK